MFSGVLKKMYTEIDNEVKYYLDFKDHIINFNQCLEKKISLKLIGFQCLSCHEEIEIFRQGFCKKCFFKSPLAGEWIMKPELSKAHLDIEDRNLDFERKIQLQPHIVYFAISSHIKVGVTRKSQLITRWIDQGADRALALFEFPNRFLAGNCEVILKKNFSDKTNWRKMLSSVSDQSINFKEAEKFVDNNIEDNIKAYLLQPKIYKEINFPVTKYPEKVNGLNLRKEMLYSGKLKGIKGQYLIFEDSTVFNIRSNEGLRVEINIE